MGVIDWLLCRRRSGTETEYDHERAHRGARHDHVLINVIYADDSEDIVPDFIFEQLLQLNKIKRFYRYSESRWVTVGVDPVRKSGKGRRYKGPERRKPRRRM